MFGYIFQCNTGCTLTRLSSMYFLEVVRNFGKLGTYEKLYWGSRASLTVKSSDFNYTQTEKSGSVLTYQEVPKVNQIIYAQYMLHNAFEAILLLITSFLFDKMRALRIGISCYLVHI